MLLTAKELVKEMSYRRISNLPLPNVTFQDTGTTGTLRSVELVTELNVFIYKFQFDETDDTVVIEEKDPAYHFILNDVDAVDNPLTVTFPSRLSLDVTIYALMDMKSMLEMRVKEGKAAGSEPAAASAQASLDNVKAAVIAATTAQRDNS